MAKKFRRLLWTAPKYKKFRHFRWSLVHILTMKQGRTSKKSVKNKLLRSICCFFKSMYSLVLSNILLLLFGRAKCQIPCSTTITDAGVLCTLLSERIAHLDLEQKVLPPPSDRTTAYTAWLVKSVKFSKVLTNVLKHWSILFYGLYHSI